MRTMRWLAAVAVTGAVLAGCARSPDGGVEYGETLDLGVPGEVIETVPAVAGYPACGNEPIVYEGTTWYPFEPANLDEFPQIEAMVATGGGLGGGTTRVALPAVVEPGVGDDVGTLTIYEDGLAFWISDSGDLETWLTDQELEYWWQC